MISTEELLQTAAKDGSFNVTEWSRVLESLLARLEVIVYHEFPVPSTPRINGIGSTTSSQERQRSLSPPMHPPSSPPLVPASAPLMSATDDSNSNIIPEPASSLPSQARSSDLSSTTPAIPSTPQTPAPKRQQEPNPPSSSATPTAPVQPPQSPRTLPQPLHTTYTYIHQTLSQNFSTSPPHTLQRLAELVLHPKKHYRSLHAYLNALDRAVAVSSSVDAFPLPGSEGGGSNGQPVLVNGVASPLNSTTTMLGSDEALGGALLTPIPWLNNNTNTSTRRRSSGSSATLSNGSSTSLSNGVASSSSTASSTSATSTSDSSVESQIAQGDADGDAEMTTGGAEGEGDGTMESLRDQGAVTQGELLRQEQEASSPPAPVASAADRARDAATARAGLENLSDAAGMLEDDASVTVSASGEGTMAGVEGILKELSGGGGGDAKNEVPHARGPEAIGPEDTGKVEGKQDGGLDMEAAVGRRGSGAAPLSPPPAQASTGTTGARTGVEKMEHDAPEGSLDGAGEGMGKEVEKDEDGDVVIADADGLTDGEKDGMESTGDLRAPDAVDATGR